MAEAGGQEKTEQPTGKRRRDARKEGNVFQSRDVATVVMLIGVFSAASLMIPLIYTNVRSYSITIWDSIGSDQMEDFLSGPGFFAFVSSLAKCSLPLLLVAFLLGILSHGVQTRFNVSFKSIQPKLSKLNPISGIKKLFSLRNVVELLKNLIKIILLLVLLLSILEDDVVRIARTLDMNLLNSATLMLELVWELVKKVCIAFTVVAFFDFLFQRWQYEKDLKMTKQEVKEEYKQTEGNPEIKGRIKKIQRNMAMSRMMQKVPQADVIIRNPTHFAVALKYDPKKHGAPIVLAKGQDELALRIIKKGEEHQVAIVENRPLARALYAQCELDQQIPAEYYGAVAEILVYIYKASHREDMFQ